MSMHSQSTAFKLISSRYVEILTIVSLLFIIQTGLLPFDFFNPDDNAGHRGLFTFDVDNFTLPDILSNIFLYIPLGFCLQWRLFRLRRNRLIRWVIAVGGGVVTSGIIEWIQCLSPARVSSLIDLISNTIGCVIGGVFFAGLHQYLPRFVAVVMAELRTWRLLSSVKAFMLALVFFSAMPFSFSISPGLLKREAAKVNVVPFASAAGDIEDADEAMKRHDHRAYAFARWRLLERCARWVVECLAFALLAQLMIVLLRSDYGFTIRTSTMLTGWYCVGFAALLSVIQFPVISRHVDTTDILFRSAGSLSVVLMTWWKNRSVGLISMRQTFTNLQRQARTGLYLTMAYIFYSGVIPLTFAPKEGTAIAPVAATDPIMPFLGYFYTRFDIAADDIIEKIATYSVLAIMLVVSTRWYRRGSLGWRAYKVAKFGVFLSIPIEIVQIFIPVRIATITDLMLAATGCVAGVLMLEVLANACRLTLAPELATATKQPKISPVDELIQTLMEPDPNAPKESSPKRTAIDV